MGTMDTGAAELFAKLELGMQRFATRTSEAIDCQNKESGEKGLIWLLRSALADEAAEADFLSRLRLLLSLGLPLPQVSNFGAADGNAYLFTEQVGGAKLAHFDGALEDRLTLFREAIRVVATCHEHGIFLGDICEDSFIVRPRGDLSLIAFLGPFEGRKVNASPPSQVFYYLSPEQRNGLPPQIASDVFALGILGYRLFTGQYPVSKPQNHQLGPQDDLLQGAVAPSQVDSRLPRWIDVLIGKALQIRFVERFSSAPELLTALDQGMDKGELSLDGRWSSSALIVRSATKGIYMYPENNHQEENDSLEGSAETVATPTQSPRESKSPKFILLAGVGLLIGALAAGVVLSKKQTQTVQKPALEYVELLPPDLQEAVKTVLGSEVSQATRVASLQAIGNSDNPASFSLLASIAKIPEGQAIRRETLNVLSIKLKDLSLGRSGETLRSWGERALATGQDPALYATFSNLLKAADLTLPLTARRDALHRASVDDSGVALQMAAALALDDPDTEHFLPVLRQLILGDELTQKTSSGELKGVSGLGIAALLAKNKILAIAFEKDIQSLILTVSEDELRFMLRSFIQIDSALVYDVANEMLRRQVVTGMQAVPLKALMKADRMAVSRPTKTALVNLSTGIFTSTDIESVGKWLSTGFEPVLLSVCATSSNKGVALEAFEILAGRNLDTDPARELMQWFRAPAIWKNRKELVTAFGVLSQHRLVSDAQVAAALDPLMPYAASGSLFELFIKNGDPRLVRMMLDRVAPITASDLLLALVKHADRGIRISAVRALQGRNEVRVLQDLVHGYETEKDPEVRRAYEENHWVVKNRG